MPWPNSTKLSVLRTSLSRSCTILTHEALPNANQRRISKTHNGDHVAKSVVVPDLVQGDCEGESKYQRMIIRSKRRRYCNPPIGMVAVNASGSSQASILSSSLVWASHTAVGSRVPRARRAVMGSWRDPTANAWVVVMEERPDAHEAARARDSTCVVNTSTLTAKYTIFVRGEGEGKRGIVCGVHHCSENVPLALADGVLS